MKVFIAGATGDLGRQLIALFAREGHALVGLARTEEKAARIRAAGAPPPRRTPAWTARLLLGRDVAEITHHVDEHLQRQNPP